MFAAQTVNIGDVSGYSTLLIISDIASIEIPTDAVKQNYSLGAPFVNLSNAANIFSRRISLIDNNVSFTDCLSLTLASNSHTYETTNSINIPFRIYGIK